MKAFTTTWPPWLRVPVTALLWRRDNITIQPIKADSQAAIRRQKPLPVSIKPSPNNQRIINSQPMANTTRKPKKVRLQSPNQPQNPLPTPQTTKTTSAAASAPTTTSQPSGPGSSARPAEHGSTTTAWTSLSMTTSSGSTTGARSVIRSHTRYSSGL